MRLFRLSVTQRIVKTLVYLLVAFYLIYFIFGEPPICLPLLPNLAESTNLQNISSFSYFSSNLFQRNNLPPFRVQWYSSALKAMEEPSFLFPSNPLDESYRFLWLRSFHRPISVRVWKVGESYYLNVKQLERPIRLVEAQRNHLATNETRSLTEAEWKQFITLLHRSCYWSLPTEVESYGTDGARWVFEGVREGQYHVADRWSPKRGNYREMCLFLLKLTQLDLGRIY